MDFETLWEEFISDSKRVSKFNERFYPHFDNIIPFTPKNQERIKKILANKNEVKLHGFLPFIKTTFKTPRFKKDSSGVIKKTLKDRPICNASHIDSYIYTWYSFLLNKKYEEKILNKEFSSCVTAYRSFSEKKSNIEFAKEIFDEIKIKKNCVVLAFDIKGFFDNMDHVILKSAWENIIDDKLNDDEYNVYKSITKFNWVSKEKILREFNFPKNFKPLRYCNYKEFDLKIRKQGLIKKNFHKGVPQGSPISAVLSNVYMFKFDEEIYGLVKRLGGFYRRYSDDIIVISDLKNALDIYNYVINTISGDSLKLKVNRKKTETFLFKENKLNEVVSYDFDLETNFVKIKRRLQYLGFEFDGQNIFIRSSSLSRYHRKMKAYIKVTVNRAYGKKSRGESIFRKKIFERYSIKGRRNFITYASRSKNIMSNGGQLNSISIEKQYKCHFLKIKKSIKKKAIKREAFKIKRGLFRKRMF